MIGVHGGGGGGGGRGGGGLGADEDDDLYEDFNYNIGLTQDLQQQVQQQQAQRSAIPASRMGLGTSMGGGPVPSGTAAAGGGGGDARPMTSVQGAGYQSGAGRGRSFDPLAGGAGGRVAPLAEKSENGPEDLAKEMEKQVHKIMEESAAAAAAGNHMLALEKAKEAGKRERALCKHRESNNLIDQINLDLTYAVCFALANAYQQCKMYDDALNTYSLIVRNKQYLQAGRLRVNMGNIYYEQREYPMAIKNYRMAIDQIPSTGNELRYKIFRNIGNAFVRLGQFQDAIQAYETIMQGVSQQAGMGQGMADIQTGYNLILCYYALGARERMQRQLTKLLEIPIPGVTDVEDEDDDLGVGGRRSSSAGGGRTGAASRGSSGSSGKDEDEIGGGADAGAEFDDGGGAGDGRGASGQEADGLKEELQRRQREAHRYILTACKLIAPVIEDNWVDGYRWVMETLKPDYEALASQMEIELALQYMKRKEFDEAMQVLKSFERKEASLQAMAATNLSFIYFLEGDVRQAERHADVAVRMGRYNAKALVNKANCLYVRGGPDELERARELYLEAIGVEADCVEAIFNLGLVELQMQNVAAARQAFEKFHQILPRQPEVTFSLAMIAEQLGSQDRAITLLKELHGVVPTDPDVCTRLGQMLQHNGEEADALAWHQEAYNHYPVNLDVISWLGVWYVKSEMYEQAIQFFERAAQVQPSEEKWQLMVASCYRRMGNYPKALEQYEAIYRDFPNNLECLRYLIALCKDLGKPYDEYQQALESLQERNPQLANQAGSRQTTSAAVAPPVQVPRPNAPSMPAGEGPAVAAVTSSAANVPKPIGAIASGAVRVQPPSGGIADPATRSPMRAPNAAPAAGAIPTSEGAANDDDEFDEDLDVGDLLA